MEYPKYNIIFWENKFDYWDFEKKYCGLEDVVRFHLDC